MMARGKDGFLSYKGYSGSVDVSPEDNVIHGRILYVRDAVLYESSDVVGLKVAFQEAVDNYLSFCSQVGEPPEKPFSGSFNIRIPAALHREAVITSDRAGTSLNKWVEEAIRQKVYSAEVSGWVAASASKTESFADGYTTYDATNSIPHLKEEPKLQIWQ